MAPLIKPGAIIQDDWVKYDRFRSLGGAQRVLASRADLDRYPRFFERSLFELGLQLDVDDAVEDIAGWLPRLSLVSLDFPSFADGRAFSQARLLRERFDYHAEIRARGEVLRDQLSFMQRCGFTQFSLAEGEDVEQALSAFADISLSYQPEPLRQRLDQVVNA